MTIDDIKQEIINSGKDPEDFIISIEGNLVTVACKPYYPFKQLVRTEDAVLGIEITEKELENIQLGRQITDLELHILNLEKEHSCNEQK